MTRCRLIYRSTCVDETMTEAAFEALARESAEKNAVRKITGMLLLSGDKFLQVLEGPVRAVNQLYAQIINDKRHDNVTLVTYEPLGSAYFSQWDMVMLDLYNLPLEPRRLLMNKYESHDGQIRIPDRLHEIYALLLDARAICQQPDTGSLGLRPLSLASSR